MDDDRSGNPERARLPGYDPAADARYRASVWEQYQPREYGIRRTRHTSAWTAAALVAGVAVTTGYLAHNVPATSSGSGTSGKSKTSGTVKPGKARVARNSAPVVYSPVVHSPVVTSGGSGAAAGSTGGRGDN